MQWALGRTERRGLLSPRTWGSVLSHALTCDPGARGQDGPWGCPAAKMAGRLHRTYWCGTSRRDPMAPLAAPTSSSITGATSMLACPDRTEPTTIGNVDQRHIVHYWAGKTIAPAAHQTRSERTRPCAIARDLDEDVRDRVGAFGPYESLPAVPPRAQEDRDAMVQETDSQIRPASATRPERRQRRIIAYCNRA